MFFWKSMPVTDLKMLASKYLAGAVLFPAIIVAIAAVTGLMFYLFVAVATMVYPGLILPLPLTALGSFGQITAFAVVHLVLSLLWYAPFLAWVGGLSTVFGRWSLPLAFVIPGLIVVVENITLFGTGPRGGYVWAYLSQRWQYGLGEMDYGQIAVTTAPFDALYYIQRLLHETDWLALVTGLVFAAAVMWLASQYRRRRIN
jgi:ABC-2 type transport system permease protein